MSASKPSVVWTHFNAVRRLLRAKFGAGAVLECGITAEAAESDFKFENIDSLAAIKPCASAMYRLHFEVDADNISDDHVVFLWATTDEYVILLHSYAGVHPVRMERWKWNWLSRAALMCESSNAVEWILLFSLQRNPPKFLKPMSITCHCSQTLMP